jgi:hypothetical protein
MKCCCLINCDIFVLTIHIKSWNIASLSFSQSCVILRCFPRAHTKWTTSASKSPQLPRPGFKDQELQGKLGVVKLENVHIGVIDRLTRSCCKFRNTTYQKCWTEREKYSARMVIFWLLFRNVKVESRDRTKPSLELRVIWWMKLPVIPNLPFCLFSLCIKYEKIFTQLEN